MTPHDAAPGPRSDELSMVARARASGPGSEHEMTEWKRLVARAVDTATPLHLHFFGGANQIIGYRAYYMLQFAKAAGVRLLTLHTDGDFWIDEATAWLSESGLDQIVLHRSPGAIPPALRQRIADLRSYPGHRPDVVLAVI